MLLPPSLAVGLGGESGYFADHVIVLCNGRNISLPGLIDSLSDARLARVVQNEFGFRACLYQTHGGFQRALKQYKFEFVAEPCNQFDSGDHFRTLREIRSFEFK